MKKIGLVFVTPFIIILSCTTDSTELEKKLQRQVDNGPHTLDSINNRYDRIIKFMKAGDLTEAQATRIVDSCDKADSRLFNGLNKK